jgi:hypothetical protein
MGSLAILLAGLLASGVVEGAVWQERSPHGSADTALLKAPLARYRALTVNLGELHALLAAAPEAHGAAAPLWLELPMPDGTLQTFAVRKSQVMAPALAVRYPRIHSYAAVAVDHPEVQARLDDSPLGFSAMIRGTHGVAMIQPAALGAGTQYIVFDRHDIGASAEPFRCGVDGFTASDAAPILSMPQTTTGATIRTYRLALAATAEYTAYFGGTVADGLAAVVQAVNRVNGIYLTDIAVQFELVANDDLLIYTDAKTDPYTNDKGAQMLGQNQKNIDNVIGAANYDFGHVFSTGGGGIADLAAVCTSRKAEGVTGSSNPVGDAFWVDYVVHEMGHQMGADHSFNSTDGNCGGGNRAASQAVEPGSGSTIMAYAGICAPSDLQPHSDPYFSAVSLVPIVNVLATSGATCGTAVTSTDAAPVVATFPDHTIPAQTAFELSGSATDSDDDALTYTWEEMDLGTASPPEGDDGTRPIFRSFNPTQSPVRIVPTLERVLAHDLTIDVPTGGEISGEYWATTTRDLDFRLTVRDNHADGGATASSDTIVHVTSVAGPFRITAPAAGSVWLPGATATVSWNVANTTAAPVSCASVDILLSTDGGQTFPTTLAAAVPNSGTAGLTVPDASTPAARVEVQCHDNIFFDISPADFAILGDDIFQDGFE